MLNKCPMCGSVEVFLKYEVTVPTKVYEDLQFIPFPPIDFGKNKIIYKSLTCCYCDHNILEDKDDISQYVNNLKIILKQKDGVKISHE